MVADIGDNDGLRASVTVFKIPQPRAGDHTVTPRQVSLSYSDGPRNSESVIYLPASGRLMVVSKLLLGARIYETPPHAFSQPTATLSPVADAPMMSTDATLLPGRGAIVVRTYRDAVIYHYPEFTFWQDLDLPTQEMGESIAAVPGGKAVWVGSEGVNSPVWAVPLPDLTGSGAATGSAREARTSQQSRAAHSEAGSAAADGDAVDAAAAASGRTADPQAAVTTGRNPDRSWLVRLGTSAGALVVVVGAVVLLSRMRRAGRTD